ncbi:MAG TPA: aminotransferase class IV, partial [Burkholderiaceae bacterium]|nr:aminotransferase class IV [Burkholderiaceae bacterium]
MNASNSMELAEPLAYLSVGGQPGDWAPVSQTRVPVLDRGFIFGDGVYEVVPIYGGRPFRIEQHLARLARSLRELRIDDPQDAAGWTSLVEQLASRNAHLGADLMVYLQITRGVAKRDHAFPKGAIPTVFGMANPWSRPTQEQIERGLATVSMDDNRWGRCDIKAIALLGNVLARQYAVDHDAAEVIMFRDGY